MAMNAVGETTVCSVQSQPIYSATDLTKGGTVAQIQLMDQLYTLRITRAGKLILTK